MGIDDDHRPAAKAGRLAMAAAALLLIQASPELRAGPDAPSPGAAAASDGEPEPKTLKERLSDKASDEQRIDDCGVAPERRGPKPRSGCPTGSPTPPTVTSGIR